MNNNVYQFDVVASRSFYTVRQENFIAGPFYDIRWQQMRDVAESIGFALADVYAADQTEVEFISGFETDGDIVVPLVRCVLHLSQHVATEEADSIVQQLLLVLTSEHDLQSPLFAVAGDESVQETLKIHAQNLLVRKGGERIATPMAIRSATGEIAHLHGSFGRRPPDVLDCDTVKINKAIVVMLSTEKREGLAITIGERKRLAFSFSDKHVGELGWSLILNAQVGISVEESLDAKGRRMQFVREVARCDREPGADFCLN